MGKPKPLSEDGLYQYALKALAARARSTGELRRMLERRAARKADAAQVLGRLKESGYLNDQKFAQSYAAWRLENQRLGRFRVERDLRARLVAPRLAERAVEETNRRRAKQLAYNQENGITPQSIVKPVDMSLVAIAEADYATVPLDLPDEEITSPEQLEQAVSELERQMREAARQFEFEKAAALRDRIRALKNKELFAVRG